MFHFFFLVVLETPSVLSVSAQALKGQLETGIEVSLLSLLPDLMKHCYCLGSKLKHLTKGLICLTELTLENGLSSESEKKKKNKIRPFQFFFTKTGVMQTQGI